MSTPSFQNTQRNENCERKALMLSLLGDLHRVALQLTQSNAEAEELVAETVARACENFSSLRDITKGKQWLLRILTNTFISSCRTKKHRHQFPYIETSDEDEDLFSLYNEISNAVFSERNPERELVAKLLDEDIQSAIATLPEEYRVVVVLCDVEGFSYEEIATTLEIPLGTVRSRLSRGRSFLQRRLYHHAADQGWIKKESSARNTEHEPCECERTNVRASAGVSR